jgi:hypothetical protein
VLISPAAIIADSAPVSLAHPGRLGTRDPAGRLGRTPISKRSGLIQNRRRRPRAAACANWSSSPAAAAARTASPAVDRARARVVHQYIAGYFRDNPLLRSLVRRENDAGLGLSNNVEIVIATNSFRSVRGRTIACAIFHEAAFWREKD